MECSVELPIENLSFSDQFDYDFVIASTCIEHPEYKAWYKQSTRFMMLDNGAFETGRAVGDEQYIDLALQIHPSILVIPDVYKKPKESLDRFYKFIEAWGKLGKPEEIKLMGVIQAGGSVETAHSLGTLYLSYKIPWIGVPYACELDRYNLISSHPEWENVHILGLPVLTEIFGLQLLKNVKTIDSSLPVKATKEGEAIEKCLTADTYVLPLDTSLNKTLLSRNLDMFHSACNGDIDLRGPGR